MEDDQRCSKREIQMTGAGKWEAATTNNGGSCVQHSHVMY